MTLTLTLPIVDTSIPQICPTCKTEVHWAQCKQPYSMMAASQQLQDWQTLSSDGRNSTRQNANITATSHWCQCLSPSDAKWLQRCI